MMHIRKKYEKIIKKIVFGLLSFIITLTSIQLSVASSFYAAQAITGPYANEDVMERVTKVAEVKHEPGKSVEAPAEVEMQEASTEVTQGIEPLPTEVRTIYDEILQEGYHEDVTERTTKTKTFVKGTKSETFIFMSDVHFETADGILEEYDLTLEKAVPTARMFASSSVDAVYEPKQTNLPIKIPEKISPKTPLTMQSVYGETTLAPMTTIADPEVKGQVARYTVSGNQMTDIVTLDSGVKLVETFTQTLPEEITYEKTVPQGYEIKTLTDDFGIAVVENTTNRVVETINIPRVTDANNHDLSGIFRIKAEENQGMGTYAITVYQLGEVTPLPQVIPSFPIQLEVSDILLNQAQVVIYGINLYNGSQTYGPGKGNAFGDMFMLGFNNDSHYYPTGLYRGLVNTVVDDWHGLIGDNRTITDAKFGLLEFTASSTSFTNDDLSFRIYRVENDYGGRPDNVTWDSWIGASANLTANDALVFNKELNTFAEFNIKEAVNAWYSGAPDYGLFLDAAREDAGLLFLNHDSSNSYLNNWGGMDGRPYIKVTHEKQEQIPDDYNINDTTLTLRPFTSAEQGGLLHFQALGFDGIAQPGSVVDVEVYEVKTGKVIHSQAAGSPSGFRAFPYYEPPLYPAIDKVQKYYGLSHNWQAPALLYTKDLAKNTLYGVRVRAKKIDDQQKVTEQGAWIKADTFQVYKATGFDHLPRILNYYGLSSTAERLILLQDNHMRDELILENNEIFVRNPKKNQEKAYVAEPLTEKDKEQIDGYLMGQGKHCEFGYEPINLNTGNFYYTNEDGQWFDYDKQFVFSRNYNSVAGGTEGMFGRNWEFSWNQHLTFRADGSAIFHDGTGKRITLDKQADGIYTAPFGEQLTLEEVKVGEKDYTYDIDYYDVVEQTPKTQTDKIGVYEYRLSTDSGMVYLFTRDGYLKQIILDRYGKTMDFTYDENQLLQKLTTPTGKALLFNYTESGYVSEIKQPDGTSLHYTYDTNGNLLTFRDTMGYTMTYEYADTTNPYIMTSYLDRENNDAIIHNTYDDKGRVVKQVDAKNDTVTFAYFSDRTEITNFNGDKEYVYIDENKRTTKKVSADGLEKIQNYDVNNNLITQDLPSDEPMTFVFDGKQNKLQETRVDGKTKQYEYNNQSMPTKVTNFDGTVTTFTYDSYDNMTGVYYADGSSMETTYNDKGQKLTEKDRNGNIVTYGYDSAGNQVTETNAFGTKTKTYDALSMVTSETDAAGLSTAYLRNKRGELLEQRQPKATKVFSYDADGQKVYEKDPNGAEKRYVYDAWSRVIEEHDSYGVKKSSYDSNGNLVKSTDELGNVTTYTYDLGNRLIETRNPGGTTSTNRYDGKGRLVGTTDILGNETITSYDDVLNKIQSTTDAAGRTTSYEYDTLGNLVKTTYSDGLVETQQYNSLNQLVESTDKIGMVTTYRYDYNGNTVETNSGGRITKTILGAADMKTNEEDELGHQTTYTYKPTQLVDTVTMKNGMVTRYEYDNAYNITAVIDASGNRTSKTYDANNNVLTETDELGNTTTKTYTTRNQLATNTAADGGVTQYVYDAKGQQIAVIDPLGNRSETTYDAMGRTKTTKDARGFITTNRYNAVGQLIETENPLGEKQRYTYTQMGLTATETDATGKVTTYEYNSNDAIIKQSDSYGEITEHTYDTFGRLIETKNEQGHTTKTTYGAYGNKATETDIRGNTTTYTYDDANQVIETVDALGNLSKQEYTPISQKLVETEKAADYSGEQKTISTYDALARLDHTTDENGTETHFTYFDNGKVKSVTSANGAVTSYTYTATGLDETVTDPNGGVTRYDYDTKGQLIKTTDPEGNTTQKEYDANGNVMREIDPLGFAVEMTYDSLNRTIEQKDKRGNITKQAYNIFGAVTETLAPNGVKTKTVYDNQGRAVKTIDGNGNSEITTYDEFSRVDKVKSTNGYTTQNHYNRYNDMTKQTNSLGEILGGVILIRTEKIRTLSKEVV
ncbi:hypothetical protein AwErysi_00890 [Erysipelotrichaceae bacterium]|nr:hypothetical protein AwErysi_00890 [Erysipelotrichaceae bacterium]